MKKGFIHLYTGDGKGKTTAAIGLAVRAAGAGLKVHIIQFAKGRFSSEMTALKHLKNISIKKFGASRFIRKSPARNDVLYAYQGLAYTGRIIASGHYDMVILDEIAVAIDLKLISVNDVLALIQTKPAEVELILTGRNAPKDLIAVADLVTEMREIKHYYHAGVPARTGVEM
jgi:cob(I)alamin adenosyltransferase